MPGDSPGVPNPDGVWLAALDDFRNWRLIFFGKRSFCG